MKIVCVADLHGHLPEIPECDLLLIGGDVCPLGSEPGYGGSLNQQERFLDGPFTMWLHRVPAANIVGVAGNHDFIAFDFHEMMGDLPWTYLLDEATEVDGFKIWGSPFSNFLPGWVFMETDDKLAHHWSLIPNDIDILMVHGPCRNFGDKTLRGELVGSISLSQRIKQLKQLKLFVCGHIHEAYESVNVGNQFGWLQMVNASHVDFPGYQPVNSPVVVEL